MNKEYLELERMIDTLLEENKKKIEVSKANNYDCELLEERRKDLERYKQSLIKTQKQEKVLSIIKEKNVDIWLLKSCLTVELYNFSVTKIDNCKVFNLTQEEFNLVKRYVNG